MAASLRNTDKCQPSTSKKLKPPVDVAPVDAAPFDVVPVDAAPVDVAPVDAAPFDVAPVS